MSYEADIDPIVHVEAVVLRAQPCAYHAFSPPMDANPNGYVDWCGACRAMERVAEPVIFEESSWQQS